MRRALHRGSLAVSAAAAPRPRPQPLLLHGDVAASVGAIAASAGSSAASSTPALVASFCGTFIQRRHFGITDGPFRHIKPRPIREAILSKKKHFNEVLVMADGRKLMETAQEVLSKPEGTFPTAFWEVLAKRSIQSMHLLNPWELAMLARAFDKHNVELPPRLDVYLPILHQVETQKELPGLAILVLMEVLPRRVAQNQANIPDFLRTLGRRSANVMYELSAAHAIRILEALSLANIKDVALCSRVARKVGVQLEVPGALSLQDISAAASSFAHQGHRDLDLLKNIAESTGAICESLGRSEATTQAAQNVHDALLKLGIDEIPSSLTSALASAQPA